MKSATSGFGRLIFGVLLTGFLGTIQLRAEVPKRIGQEVFGKTKDGTEVKQITLRNSNGLSAQIITYGAIIKEFHAPDRVGAFKNVLLTTDSIEKFEGFNASAAIIGRVANRIAGAGFDLDGKNFKLPANHGIHSIHGGHKGFDKVVWTVTKTSADGDRSSVSLRYLSKDGEEGYPGNLTTTVVYTLTDSNEFHIDYHAETDKPTIVNLTNHAYWNLAGGGDCLDHILMIPSQSYTPTDRELIPTGEILPLNHTLLDFREPTRIGDRIKELDPGTGGYDHNYVLGNTGEIRTAARLVEPKSGRTMEVLTTQPAVQLYTGNHVGHTAVCLETQHYPDSIHHENFPSVVVSPEKPYRESAIFRFLTD